jgi:HAD domain in Swiss Army Knife RNA repair proteins
VDVVARPAFLIDVDGVLNPLRRPQRDAGFRRHRIRVDGITFTVWLAPHHGRWLRSVADQAGLELTWATAWEQHANSCIAPRIGLPQLPVVDFPASLVVPPAGHIWKLPNVARAMDGRPFVWADDQFTQADLAWADDRTAGGLPTLLLACQPQTGLTQAHVDAARAWAATLPVAA